MIASKSAFQCILSTFFKESSWIQKFRNLNGFIIFSFLMLHFIINVAWSDPLLDICSTLVIEKIYNVS